MVEIAATSTGGSRIRLRVRPGAKASEIEGEHGGALKVAVSAAPEKGRANRAVERLLAEALDTRISAVSIVAGEKSRDKVVEIRGLEREEIRRRLSEILGSK